MKLPKTRKTYCPTCKTHTEHKIIEGKKKTRGSAHPLSFGSKKRIKHRGKLGIGNHGKYSKPAITKWRMAGRKTSKKVDLRFECSKCKKMHMIAGGGFRARKIEFKQG
ncbi:MAG TPA: 50S ribosomal protein L44e [Candidatus Nanoarchaeia archaeon]|nr:50S ribosomal protein L44e [Candidatus Nanoarchaeia archaeon]